MDTPIPPGRRPALDAVGGTRYTGSPERWPPRPAVHDPAASVDSVLLDIPPLLDRLCYRYPSLLVDAVLELEPDRRVVAVKNVTVNEEFFQGHFPGTPLMPGVLMIETLVQVATILLLHDPSGRPAQGPRRRALLRGVNDAKFRRQVVPGDRLWLEVTLGHRRGP